MTEPTPVDLDVHAIAPELLARAHTDYAAQQAAARAKQEQGGTGERHGILPSEQGGDH